MLTAATEAWLDARGLDPELASKLGFTTVRSGGGGEELKIPFVVDGVVVNHKYRGIAQKTFRQDKGGAQVLWNHDCLLDETLAAEPLIITEGELDAMAAIQAGYARVVSVPGGAPSSPVTDGSKLFQYVEHARPRLEEIPEIILAVDGDGPGSVLLHELALRLGMHRVKFVRYPKGCKDLGDALRIYGSRGVVETLRTAAPIAVPGLFTIDTLPPYERRTAFSTGFAALDPHFNVRMGDLSVWTGLPGHGKTTLNNFLTFSLARQHGFKILVASFEQHAQADHIPNLINLYLGYPLRDPRTMRMLASDLDHEAARQFIRDHYLFMSLPDDALEDVSLDWVFDRITVAAKRDGIKLAVVDPWNEIDHCRDAHQSLTEYVGYAVKSFKRLAKKLDIHIMIVAHPAKDKYVHPPGLYAISDSAHWANKPDAGIVIWKPHGESEIAEIHVVKSRYWDQIGRPGKVRVRYNPTTRTYEQIDWPKEDETDA